MGKNKQMTNIIEKAEIKGLNFAKVPTEYAKFLACGFDSIQESFDITITPAVAELLQNLKQQAERNGSAISLASHFHANIQMQPTGASGFTYRLANDDYQILIRNPAGQQKDWQVSVRYSAAGLWEHGHDCLKEQVVSFLQLIADAPNSEDWHHVTRADFCFDFYSPKFAKEMTYQILDNIVATSKTKVNTRTKLDLDVWAKGGKVETFTIGSKKSLQVSVYDKTKEITEASGKTWFYEVWGRKYEDSVYRVEIRMSKEWLKDRNIKTIDQLKDNLRELLNDALRLRRLAVSGSDSNRSRWKVHPLWVMCFDVIGNPLEIVKIGRYVTQRKQYIDYTITKQTAGCIRTLVVLKAGIWDDETYIKTMQDITNLLFEDKQRNVKIKNIQERYKYVEEAV